VSAPGYEESFADADHPGSGRRTGHQVGDTVLIDQ